MIALFFRNAQDKKWDDTKDLSAIWILVIVALTAIVQFAEGVDTPGGPLHWRQTVAYLIAGIPTVLALFRFWTRIDQARMYEQAAEDYFQQSELIAKLANLAQSGKIAANSALELLAKRAVLSEQLLADFAEPKY
jgi:hypothetical protein